jgi:hypothetical protein
VRTGTRNKEQEQRTRTKNKGILGTGEQGRKEQENERLEVGSWSLEFRIANYEL